MSRTFWDFDTKVNRRSFLKGCAMVCAAMGLSDEIVPKMAEAASNKKRPPTVWLHFQECTGCTESLLRASHPDVARLILDLISVDYHETLLAAAGTQAEELLTSTIEENKGKFICIVEGGIPTKDGGIYCKIGGKTAIEIINEVASKSAAVIAIGSCAAFGGIQAANPNPTGAKGVSDIINSVPIINCPGCPPNPIAFLGTVLHYLTFGRLPATDKLGRPLFAYGRRIHDHCERRPHFDDGRFVEQFGDCAHKNGYCLYKVGCKGPETFSHCPSVRFNDVGVWPVSVGHGCVGCTEPNFWDTMTPFYERLPGVPIPGDRGSISSSESFGKKVLGITGAAVALHALAGVGKKMVQKKDNKEE